MPLLLRPYQERGVAEIRAAFTHGARRVLFTLPTGGGKTTVFSHITSAAAARGNRVCVLVHRQELVDQVSGSLAAMGVPHGIVAGGYPETPEPVQVASVASLVRRLDRVSRTIRSFSSSDQRRRRPSSTTVRRSGKSLTLWMSIRSLSLARTLPHKAALAG